MALAASRQRQRRRDSGVVPAAGGGGGGGEATRTRTRSRSDRHRHERERERPAPTASIEIPSMPSPRILFPAIPKNLTSTTGESVTRAGLLVRTSSDARASGELPRRHRRESHVAGGSTNSPLLQELPTAVSTSAASGSGRGGERPRRSHRSGGDGRRERAEQPISSSRDGKAEGGESPRAVRRDVGDAGEEPAERPHRSSRRRESDRRERRPVVAEKEKKTSFFGSMFKAFK